MKAVKNNREYTIPDNEVEKYSNRGFDVYENGEKIASGKGKTVSQEEYNRVLEKLEEAKKNNTSVSDETLLPILKEYAQLKDVDTGQAATVKGIVKKIEDAAGAGDQ